MIVVAVLLIVAGVALLFVGGRPRLTAEPVGSRQAEWGIADAALASGFSEDQIVEGILNGHIPVRSDQRGNYVVTPHGLLMFRRRLERETAERAAASRVRARVRHRQTA